MQQVVFKCMPITMVFSLYSGTPTIYNEPNMYVMSKNYEFCYMYNPFMIFQKKKYNPYTTLDGKIVQNNFGSNIYACMV